MTSPPAEKFPKVFWTANVTELFERAAYYSMASFVVIYLGQLGFGDYWPSFLNSTVLWGLVYFLPILSGTISDQVGFRRSLLAAFVLLACGYFLMGYPVWFGGSSLVPTIERHDDSGGGSGSARWARSVSSSSSGQPRARGRRKGASGRARRGSP
jgi:dipeptide/tripeptide permease